MTVNHTPGPWLAQENCICGWEVVTHRDHETADDWLGFSAALGCGAHIAGSIGDHTEARTRGNEEANARLIAAAPDLLAALDEILGPLKVCHDNPNIADDVVLPIDLTMGDLRRARAAIAKATGAA